MNVDTLIKLLERGRDDALLRFSLANAYLQASQPADAVVHLRAALKHNPGYSAAWKTLGKTLAETNDAQGAAEVYRQGVVAATDKGDMQAAKEMQVFLRRLEKSLNT